MRDLFVLKQLFANQFHWHFGTMSVWQKLASSLLVLKHIDLTKSTELTHSPKPMDETPKYSLSSYKSERQQNFRGSAILFTVEKIPATKDLAIFQV